MKAPAGYDLLVPDTPRRDAGTSCLLMLQKKYDSITTDFAGKVSGSVVENANIEKELNDTSLLSPSSFTIECIQLSYDKSKTLDSNSSGTGSTINSNMPQRLFSFNIISDCEKYWTANNISYPYKSDATVAEKVAWFKANAKLIKANWTGYGSCHTGNKAYLAQYQVASSSWGVVANNTANSSTLITSNIITSWVSDRITSDGFVHFLAYTDKSDGVTPSTIYTDYISLQMDFVNSNTNAYFTTPNCLEFQTSTVNKLPAYLVEVDLKDIHDTLKGVKIDAFIQGSGASSTALTNGAKLTVLNKDMTVKATSSNDLNFVRNASSEVGDVATSSNKVYATIVSKNPSDGNIPSSVSLDFAKMRASFARPKEIIPNEPHFELPSRWALLIKNVNIAWNKDEYDNSNKTIFSLFKNSQNRMEFRYDGEWHLVMYKDGVFYHNYLPGFNVNKGQTFSVLLELTNQFKMSVFKNNGTMTSATTTDIVDFITGPVKLSILGAASETSKTDGYYEGFKFFDFTKHPDWTDGIPSETAERMLRGLEEGFENEELLSAFDKWVLNQNARIENSSIILNATDVHQDSYVMANVFPNNYYRFKVSASPEAQIRFIQYRNGKVINEKVYYKEVDDTIYIDENTLECKVVLSNYAKGTFEFYSASLKLNDTDVPKFSSAIVLDIVGDYEKVSGTRVLVDRDSKVINPLYTLNPDGTESYYDNDNFAAIEAVEEVE
jgi:hypothetical protein